MTWTFIWMAVILKIPIVAMLWLVWWAVKEEPQPTEEPDDGGGRREPPRPRRPRPPRRGPHGAESVPRSPQRIRARARRSGSFHGR